MRIPIRVKLAFALALPIAGLVAGAAFVAVDADRTASEANDETSLAAAAVGPGSLVSQLQNERNYTSVDLIGMSEVVRLPVNSVAQARANSDAALDDLRAFVAQRGPAAQAAFADGLTAIESGLAAVRARNDEYSGPRSLSNNALGDEVFASYAEIIDALLDDAAGIALEIDDAELRTGVELVDLTTRLYELRSQSIRAAVSSMLSADVSSQARLAVGSALAQGDVLDAQIRSRAVGPYSGIPVSALGDALSVSQDAQLNTFALNGELDVTALLSSVDSQPSHGVLLVRRTASQVLLDEADAVLADAEQRRSQVVAIGGAAIAIALAMIWLVSRSITQPLRSLTQQAEAMAGQKLPAAVQQVLDTPLGDDVAIPDVEPIVVKTRDEVRDVAAALNVVQESALDLAVEQAVLRRNIADSFVNLGRRNQNLLDRQLDFITALENDEADPDSLASLFRLDHLATRMRRNAESLLRLAGSEPQRRWSAPVDVNDVVRGALGEIEDFQRVHLRGIDSAHVPAGVGADLAHALAELLENALAFSPPGETVEVRGRRNADGYVLAVSDSGLGMAPDDLATANRRLAGEESFTVAPSRYLGHYVAGHLASRLGIKIELTPGPAGGLVARVDIPPSLLVEPHDEWPADSMEMTSPPRQATPPEVPVAPEVAAMPQPASGFEAEPEPEPEPEPVPVADLEPELEDAPAPVHANVGFPTNGPFTSPSSTFLGHEPLFGRDPQPEPPAVPQPAPPVSPLPPAATTPGGLVRRVPGAQRPVTEIAGRTTEQPAPEDESTPESVSSFLSDFSAGVARGIDDAGHNPWEDDNR